MGTYAINKSINKEVVFIFKELRNSFLNNFFGNIKLLVEEIEIIRKEVSIAWNKMIYETGAIVVTEPTLLTCLLGFLFKLILELENFEKADLKFTKVFPYIDVDNDSKNKEMIKINSVITDFLALLYEKKKPVECLYEEFNNKVNKNMDPFNSVEYKQSLKTDDAKRKYKKMITQMHDGIKLINFLKKFFEVCFDSIDEFSSLLEEKRKFMALKKKCENFKKTLSKIGFDPKIIVWYISSEDKLRSFEDWERIYSQDQVNEENAKLKLKKKHSNDYINSLVKSFTLALSVREVKAHHGSIIGSEGRVESISGNPFDINEEIQRLRTVVEEKNQEIEKLSGKVSDFEMRNHLFETCLYNNNSIGIREFIQCFKIKCLVSWNLVFKYYLMTIESCRLTNSVVHALTEKHYNTNDITPDISSDVSDIAVGASAGKNYAQHIKVLNNKIYVIYSLNTMLIGTNIGELILFDLLKRCEIKRGRFCPDGVTDITYNYQTRKIYLSALNSCIYEITLDKFEKKVIYQDKNTLTINNLRINLRNNRLYFSGDKTLTALNLQDGEVHFSKEVLTKDAVFMDILDDENVCIIASEEEIKVIDLTSLEVLDKIPCKSKIEGVTLVKSETNYETIIVYCDEKTLKHYNLKSRKSIDFHQLETWEDISMVFYCHDFKTVCVVMNDGLFFLINYINNKCKKINSFNKLAKGFFLGVGDFSMAFIIKDSPTIMLWTCAKI